MSSYVHTDKADINKLVFSQFYIEMLVGDNMAGVQIYSWSLWFVFTLSVECMAILSLLEFSAYALCLCAVLELCVVVCHTYIRVFITAIE